MSGLVQQTKNGATPEEIPLQDGQASLWRHWIGEAEAFRLFECLRDELAWEQSAIRIHGRERLIPRLNAWYGDAGATYRYSGTSFDPKPWTPALATLRQSVEATARSTFNSVLANYYRDGRDGVGWHSDDEPELGANPVIASLSFGSERRFTMKHKKRKEIPRLDIWLPSGSLLLMGGCTQHYWVHRIPKTVKPVGPRINLTFRRIL